jgi:hypothetical protein
MTYSQRQQHINFLCSELTSLDELLELCEPDSPIWCKVKTMIAVLNNDLYQHAQTPAELFTTTH